MMSLISMNVTHYQCLEVTWAMGKKALQFDCKMRFEIIITGSIGSI